ncbi:MAG: prolyl oligopeptidase family serine peptidase [Verrucomicrobiae bacterium]|nr:prolyl oligopeptidase family serine peptidase [Verrucomicrobiae bacterium]MCP5541615.1 prolyl oligopeptidase family serine peptidase [Akkermansiaceae bacterium]
MKTPTFLPLLLSALAVVSTPLRAQDAARPQPLEHTWTVDGLERKALIHLPAKPSEKGSPLVFGFHGHGGWAAQAARSFRLHDEWPEAVVIYMQGLPTPGRLTDPEGKRNGWQSEPGAEGDRDLKFFDAVLATAKERFKIDETRVYATGHSNGGGFTYLLWGERPEVFAAVAPSAAVAARSANKLTPKPVLHLASESDPLVKYSWQSLMIERVKTVNGCGAEGSAWAEGCTQYPSENGAPLIVFLHDGGHRYPRAGPALIVKFFKEHSLRRS